MASDCWRLCVRWVSTACDMVEHLPCISSVESGAHQRHRWDGDAHCRAVFVVVVPVLRTPATGLLWPQPADGGVSVNLVECSCVSVYYGGNPARRGLWLAIGSSVNVFSAGVCALTEGWWENSLCRPIGDSQLVAVFILTAFGYFRLVR